MIPAAPVPMPIGTTIGPYEIVGWLGAGGMGNVYRARDPRLGRDVAIKVIHHTLPSDALGVRRFEQEARAAGQLNHPNILVVYDVGTHDGAPYIVSELLEGESLRRRLDGGALGARKAVEFARQVADALAAAHDKSIVHRDIKPDNLFMTADGRAKILDFGIAKLTAPDDAEPRPPGAATDTLTGTVLGTAAYMSPEQVRGEAVDARSDIFSVGALLYEMLTGRAAFARGTAADTMSAILKEDPPDPLATNIPPQLGRIVTRCLEKVREARFQSARDLAFDLESLSWTTDDAAPAATSVPPRFLWRHRLGLAGAAAAALATATTMTLIPRGPPRSAPPSPAQRLRVDLGTDAMLATFNLQFGGAAALSSDGGVVAFVAQKGEDRPQLFVRRLSQLHAEALPGTDDALSPFFSPDGRWIGFFADLKLKKVGVTGGAPVTLADAPGNRGGSWGEDGTIVFTPHQLAGTRMLRVSSAGGNAEPLTSLAEGEVIQLWPQVLPGGKGVLYTSSSVVGAYGDADILVQPLPGGARKVVQRGGFHGRYLSSGHLVYIHAGTLFAVPFDLDRLEATGPPVPALEGVRSNSITGGAVFEASANGTLAYLPGQMTGSGMLLLDWMDRTGKTIPLRTTLPNWFNLRFAPDGRRIALDIRQGSSDIWVYELARDALTRLTVDAAEDRNPVWTPDGSRIVFASDRGGKGTLNVYWQRVDGTGDVQRLTQSGNVQIAASWHPSGRFLAFDEIDPATKEDLMILPVEGSDAGGWTAGKPRVFLSSPAIEATPMFSPDGRWLAYTSNESGRFEVYVRPFPGPGGGAWQISIDGGNFPTWSRTKRELFYGVDGRIMVTAFTTDGDSFRVGKPEIWSEGRYQARGVSRMFDLHPDGERFALAPAVPPDRARQGAMVFIFNFFEELRRIAPR